ncbi:MAG: deoxyribose-phosphate aldolase [Verrucomicrobia bacterium]|nr:MAG: deoxyribose-phosphate aldolase [Verrucomicrobiota bacterium]
MKPITPAELPAHLDAALWHPAATAADIEAFCALAHQHKLRAVCVNSGRVALAAARLEESPVKTVAFVGFPLGAADADVLRYETEVAIDLGAQEIELVFNLGKLRDGAHKQLLRDLRDVVEAAEERPVCVLLEPARLTREEIQLAANIFTEAGVNGVAIGAGFRPDSPNPTDDLRTLRELLDGKIFLKAAGDLRDRKLADALFEAGAERLGTTSPALLLGMAG